MMDHDMKVYIAAHLAFMASMIVLAIIVLNI
jgi:hypothetical protein